MSSDRQALPLSPTSLVWQYVYWPRPFAEESAVGLLRHWAAQHDRPTVYLEARADSSGIRYLVGTQQRVMKAVARTIEQLVPGSLVTAAEAGTRPVVTAARRLKLTGLDWPLETGDRLMGDRSILSALSAVDGDEHAVLQIELGRSLHPSSPPAEPSSGDQSVLSKVLIGIQPENRPGAAQAATRKHGQHGFSTTVRLGVQSTSSGRRRSLLLGIVAAIGTTEAAGVRLRIVGEAARRINAPRSSFWARLLPPQRLGVSEVSLLLAWPISDKDVPLPGLPSAHPKPVRPTPAVQTGDRVVALANAPGSRGTLGHHVGDALRHSWITGPTGTGKSTLLLNLISQDMRANRPVVVIEPKDLIADVLTRIPRSRLGDVVVLDPLSDAPVGLNPLDRSPGSGREGLSPETVADSMFGTFRSLYGESLGARSADILRNCLKVLVHRPDASLMMLPLILTNPAFRRSMVQRAVRDDPFGSGPFWQWFEGLSPEAAANIVAPLSNKIRPLLDRHLRVVLSQPRPRFNVRQVLTERKILLVPLQKGVLGPEAARLLAAVTLYDLWQAILERVRIPEGMRQPVMIYIDEVQEFLNLPTDLDDALAMSRSLRAGFHLAHQYETQLPVEMRNAFRNNARNRITFALNADDAKAAAAGQSALVPEDFTALPAHHVYARLIRQNTLQPWASGVTLPPPEEISNPDRVRRMSAERYGQPIGEIEASFSSLLDNHRAENPQGGRGHQRRRQS
ncbi:type IV secretory system conjugative DNA transfer family protein [Nocardia aurea]|uniref:Type IV secretory system conjugative DNA transfer family protein n=1 Tax=Nocardia aurea TaxID=2144174 RepID=A0ABV3FY82_9NOCA